MNNGKSRNAREITLNEIDQQRPYSVAGLLQQSQVLPFRYSDAKITDGDDVGLGTQVRLALRLPRCPLLIKARDGGQPTRWATFVDLPF